MERVIKIIEVNRDWYLVKISSRIQIYEFDFLTNLDYVGGLDVPMNEPITMNESEGHGNLLCNALDLIPFSS